MKIKPRATSKKIAKKIATAAPLSSDYFIVIVLLLAGLVAARGITMGHVFGDDWSLYMAQAKALLTGTTQELYAMNKWAMIPIPFYGPDLYPIGFPLLLAPLYYFFGLNLVIFKWSILFFLLGVVFLSYKLFQGKFQQPIFFYLLIINIAFFKAYIPSPNYILSDIPFAFFSLLAIFLAQRQTRTLTLDPRTSTMTTTTIGQGLLIGLVLGFAFAIRSVGITTLAAVVVFYLWLMAQEKNRHRLITIGAAIAAIILAFALLTLVIKKIYPASDANNYDLLSFKISSILWRVKYYFLLPSRTYVLSLLFFIIIAIGVRHAIIKSPRKNSTTRHDAVLYILIIFFTLGLLLLYRGTAGVRYIFLLIPFYYYFFVLGLEHLYLLLRNSKKNLSKKLAVLPLVVALLPLWPTAKVITNPRPVDSDITNPSITAVYQFVMTKTKPDDVICYFKPRALRLMTDNGTLRRVTFDAFYDKVRPDFIKQCNYFIYYKINPSEQVNWIPLLPAWKNKIIFENVGYAIYRLR